MPRKRHRSTWGTNEDAGNGRRRLRYWADLHDGRGYVRHSVTIVGSRRDGDEALARLRVEHSQDRPTPTLRQAWEAWYLPDLMDRFERGEASKSTVSNYLSRWESHIRPAFGELPVTDVRPLDIQSWLLSGMTRSMASASLCLLRQVLDMCVRYEAMDHNTAAARYRLPRGIERVRPKDVLTLSETVSAIDAARGTVAYLPAILCGLSSCRVGEAFGPRVDMGEVRTVTASGMTVAVVDVTRQIDARGHELPSLKTPQSERPVIVPEPWSADVIAQEGPWLCDDGCGSPVSRRAARDAWLASCERAGVSPIPLQNLRNSWRTFMRWELGVAEDMLESMMGHAGRNVGEMHYDRPREEVFAQTVAGAWMRYRAAGNGCNRDDLGQSASH
ncbi:MAG TPA: site-specific integrase [Candidatus Olsenella pullicola]|nr:site-specific integrase [Candidatus Olsenella pullicola]